MSAVRAKTGPKPGTGNYHTGFRNLVTLAITTGIRAEPSKTRFSDVEHR